QNAALVEEATAAARSMEDQAADLTRAVAVFRLVPQQAALPQRWLLPPALRSAGSFRPAASPWC
ncbi:hypothetical protein, partial [Xanthomonas arboricola]|uniref:hypothetical protein n=1 Tax=Xanthomonas arboricola TaxID=56448 RepID=UPI000D4FDD79